VNSNKPKIAIIVQRYGQQINGGAEVHARMIAEKLIANYEVVVLTSRATDYHTWEPVLPLGSSFENNIEIIRFNHPPKAHPKTVHKLNRKLRGRWLFQKFYRFIGEPKWYLTIFPEADVSNINSEKWLALQGPETYDLKNYLQENQNNYTAFIFFTYLYYTTAACIDIVGKKSILIPTMHDEPSAYLPIFKKVMAAPRFIFFNTISEKIFSEKMFSINHIQKEIVAVGIDEENSNTKINIQDRFGINKKYILYVGRIDSAKGCNELFENFIQFKKKDQNDIVLVLAGKNMIKEVKHPSIHYLGFVSDEEKTQLIKSALSLIVPSKYESLSLVLLESFINNVPVIANGNCQVLLNHIENSEGGWVYFNPKEFNSAILSSLNEIENKEKGNKGYEYVKRNYTWDKVMKKFDHAISLIESQPY
jgi:glycosyltransferase involved in cell wall biosynthesis